MKLKNAFLYDDKKRVFRPGGLVTEGDTVTELREYPDAKDCEGDLILPGLIDVHTHGRGGYDFGSASVEELKHLQQLYARQGVTTVVPTLASDTFDNLLAAVDRIRQAGYTALHLEGRYLNPRRRGAHAESLLAPLSPEELGRLLEAAGSLRVHVSAAYELDPDGRFLATVLAHGATAGLAHTDAGYEEAMRMINRGLRSFTHLFNGMPPLHHRHGGAVMAGLLSDAYTEIICDGFHLAPETVALVGRAKEPERVVLITDSMEGTGCPDGPFAIAGNPVTLKDGKAYTAEGAIAGSTLELLDGVRHYADFCGIPFAGAVAAATINPARMLGLPRVGRLAVGNRADFLVLSPSFELKAVYVGGVRLR